MADGKLAAKAGRNGDDTFGSGFQFTSLDWASVGDSGFVDVRLEVFDCPTLIGQGELDDCMGFVADISNKVTTALRRSGYVTCDLARGPTCFCTLLFGKYPVVAPFCPVCQR